MKSLNLNQASKPSHGNAALLNDAEVSAIVSKLSEAGGGIKVVSKYLGYHEDQLYEFYFGSLCLFQLHYRDDGPQWGAHVDPRGMVEDCPGVFDSIMSIVAKAMLRGRRADLFVRSKGDEIFHWCSWVHTSIVNNAYGDVGLEQWIPWARLPLIPRVEGLGPIGDGPVG